MFVTQELERIPIRIGVRAFPQMEEAERYEKGAQQGSGHEHWPGVSAANTERQSEIKTLYGLI